MDVSDHLGSLSQRYPKDPVISVKVTGDILSRRTCCHKRVGFSSSPKPAEPCPRTCRIPGGKGSGTCDSGQAPRTGRTLLVSAPVASTSSPQHRLQLVQTSPWYFQPPLSDWKCLEFHSRRQQPWRIWGRERIPVPLFPPPVRAHVSALTPPNPPQLSTLEVPMGLHFLRAGKGRGVLMAALCLRYPYPSPCKACPCRVPPTTWSLSWKQVMPSSFGRAVS